ncbi:MAG: TetR/AcrR family transcriptional regulator [Eubacteriales bacterium]|nr:TetR/AcrR family transcriptional regulator [Eubacteriales bacterium]
MKYDLSKKPSRSAKRTLHAFKDTMFFLLSAHPFEELTVNMICEQADYPRTTFYNYFDDKYDLLNYCWLWLSGEMHLEEHRTLSQNEILYLFFDKLFDFFERKQDIIHQILKNNPQTGYMFSSFRSFMNHLVRMIFEHSSSEADCPVPRELIADHYSNTLLLVCQWVGWFNPVCTRATAHEYLNYLIGDLQKR